MHNWDERQICSPDIAKKFDEFKIRQYHLDWLISVRLGLSTMVGQEPRWRITAHTGSWWRKNKIKEIEGKETAFLPLMTLKRRIGHQGKRDPKSEVFEKIQK